MVIHATEEQRAAARAYEALHVAALFEEWPPRLLDSVGVKHGDRLLDVACGTGVLAREALSRGLDAARVTGLDLTPGMLAVAEELAPDVTWVEGSAESLPFPEKTFDIVVSQFGLMFFQDRGAAVAEMHRVLSAQGRCALAVWDALENSEVFSILVTLLERLAGSAAANALRAPFVLGDSSGLQGMLQSAGFTGVELTTERGTGRYPSIRTLVEAELRGWLPLMDVHLSEDLIAAILDEAEAALAPFVTDSGELVFSTHAHIVSGTKT